MISAMDTQADLEVLWLEAWYDTKYWEAVANKMDTTNGDVDATLSAIAGVATDLAVTAGPPAMTLWATNSKAAELKRDDVSGKLTT